MTKKTSTPTKVTGATASRGTAIKPKGEKTERTIKGASAKPQIDSATRDRLIREQAYYNASGNELADWLAAEAVVDTKYSTTI